METFRKILNLLARLEDTLLYAEGYFWSRSQKIFGENLRWFWIPMYRIFLNFAKSCILSCLSKFSNKKKIFTVSFLKYKHLNLKLTVLLGGLSVAVVTYCVTKIIPTCSPVIGQLFDTTIVASIDKEWL